MAVQFFRLQPIFQTLMVQMLLFPISTGPWLQIPLSSSFRNTFRVPNGLDPDQDQCSVSPDLGPFYTLIVFLKEILKTVSRRQ